MPQTWLKLTSPVPIAVGTQTPRNGNSGEIRTTQSHGPTERSAPRQPGCRMESDMITRLRAAAALLLALVVLVLLAPAASATDSGSAEADFISRLNGVRAS